MLTYRTYLSLQRYPSLQFSTHGSSPIRGFETPDRRHSRHAEVDAGWLGNRPIALYKSLGGSAGFTIFDVGEQSVLFSQSGIYPENIAFSSMAGHLAFGNSRTGVIEVYLGGTPKEKTEHLAPRLVPQIQHNGPSGWIDNFRR